MKKDNWLDEKAKAPDPDDLTEEGLPIPSPGTTAASLARMVSRKVPPELRPVEDASAPHIPPGESGRIRVDE